MPNRHPRKSQQQWQCLIDKFRSQTDLTQQQFCQSESLSLGTFRKWLYSSPTSSTRPGKQSSSGGEPLVKSQPGAGNFGPVTIRSAERSITESCLELPGNIRLHTQSMPSAEYLHNLVRIFSHGH